LVKLRELNNTQPSITRLYVELPPRRTLARSVLTFASAALRASYVMVVVLRRSDLGVAEEGARLDQAVGGGDDGDGDGGDGDGDGDGDGGQRVRAGTQAQGLVATVETDPLRRDAVEIEHVQRGDGRGGLPLRSISLKVALYAAIRRVSAVGMSGAGAWF
jgi:hypothetical protein